MYKTTIHSKPFLGKETQATFYTDDWDTANEICIAILGDEFDYGIYGDERKIYSIHDKDENIRATIMEVE